MPKLTYFACAVVLSLAAGIAGANAAETGTKTMPDSSMYPPPTPPPIFGNRHRHECFLPSSRCNNEHRVQN